MKKTMKSLLALITTLTLAGSLLSGCGSKENTNPAPETPAPSGEETEAPAAETESSGGTTFGIEPLASKTMIDLAYFSGAEHGLVFYIMDEMGWAEELNIGFNWSYFNAGPAMMEANGSWDVGTAGAAGAVNGIVGYDVNVIGISGQGQCDGGSGSLWRRGLSARNHLASACGNDGAADVGPLSGLFRTDHR